MIKTIRIEYKPVEGSNDLNLGAQCLYGLFSLSATLAFPVGVQLYDQIQALGRDAQ